MDKEPNIGGAILGFYGAIKICLRDGYKPEDVFKIVREFVREQREVPKKANRR